MMKKFLVILTLITIAPIASATLGDLVLDFGDREMDFDGNYIARIGEEVEVTVIQTVPNTTGSGGEMSISFTGDVVSVEDLTRFDFPSGVVWQWAFNGGIAQSDAVGGIWFGKTASTDYGTYGIGSLSLVGAEYVGTVAFSFIFVTEETDLVWGGTWDGVDMTGEIGATVAVPIPEPITIALLSLGALLTRRRK